MVQKSCRKWKCKCNVFLGKKYLEGNIVEQDVKEGLKWLIKATVDGKLGNVECFLAEIYLEGLYGVNEDEKEALKWYRKVDEKGNTLAACQIGFMYLCGKGVDKDEKEGIKRIKKEARDGVGAAQEFLGDVYWKGLYGVEKDMEEALKCYREAAENGRQSAEDKLKELFYCGSDRPC